MFRSRRFFYLLALVAVTTAPGWCQRSAPSSLPINSIPDAPPVASPAPVQTIKAAAQLVVVDVVATDSKQQPVHNLKASDFRVLENNVPQQITSFEEHVALPQAAAVAPLHLPPGIFTNFTPVPEGTTANVLLLDALNTPMKDQAFVRDQLRDFLKTSPPSTRIAIFGLNDRLILLQGFTSDLALLRSVIDTSRPASSLALPDNVGNGGTKAVSDMIADVSGGAADMAQLLLSVQEFENVQASIDTQIRVKQTLDALNQLAHFLAGIPGRKNLIWFSASFPLDILPQPGAARPFDVVSNSEEEFRETTNLLTNSQVAIYPVDARGLETNAIAITKDSGISNIGAGLAQAQSTSFQNSADEHLTMDRLASDTGGQAYLDANGLSAAVAKVIANGSNYYTLSYRPSDSAPDGKFRKIQIKLPQPGVTLAYRSGYFADAPPARPRTMPGEMQVDLPGVGRPKGAQPTAPALVQANSLTQTMMHGAPNATQIMLKLQVLPESNATQSSVVRGNIFNAAPAAKLKIKGPFRSYAVDIAADARDIHITPTPDGHYQFSTEIITCVFDPTGVLIDTAVEKARGNLSPSSMANMVHTGVPFHQEVSVPVKGHYYLRIAVHDLETDRYGSVEVPVASVAKLPPLAASAPR